MEWKIAKLIHRFVLLIAALVLISVICSVAAAFEGNPDLNLDGSVNLIDLGTLAQRWLASGCLQSSLCDRADLNFDGMVNFRDFALLARNWLDVPLMQPPSVKNLAASQGVDDPNVHIYYDLIDPDPCDRCTVTLDFSTDGGQNWNQASSEDLIEPGTALYIEFDPGEQDSNSCKVRVTATDIYGKTAQAESSLFRMDGNAPPPDVKCVTASQRNDASKLVDIYYQLSPQIPDYQYYVYVQARKSEAEPFITVSSLSGDVGAGQQPDPLDIKHIVWDPTIDLGNQDSNNCCLKVVAHGFDDANSPEFSIRASEPGTLAGAVYNGVTGSPIEGAQAIVCDLHKRELPLVCSTDSDGQFSFEDLPAGEKIIIVIKNLPYPPSPEPTYYQPIWKTVIIRESSTTFLNFIMSELADAGESGSQPPKVLDVRSKYCSSPDKHAYYLDGISLQESFKATIDWNGAGSKEVRWITPNGQYTQSCSGDSVSRTFDMGRDIGIDEVNDTAGYLKVVAVRDGNESDMYTVNLNVIELPPILNLLPDLAADLLYIPVPTGQGFEYRILGFSEALLSLGGSNGINIPIFNGAMEVGVKMPKKSKKEEKKEAKRKKLENFNAAFSGMVNSDGKAEMFTVGWDKTSKKEIRKKVKGKEKEGIKLGTIKTTPRASVGINFYWTEASDKWKLGGTFDLGCFFMYETPPPPKVVALIPVGLGVIPVYVRGELSLDLGFDIGLVGYHQTSDGPLWSGGFDFEPMGKGFLGAGIAKVACVEGYLGGGFHSRIGFIPCVEWQGTYVILVGGVQVVIGPFSARVPKRYEWHPEGSESGSCVSTMEPLGIEPLTSSGEIQFEPLPRDYLMRYPDDLTGIPLAGGTEQPIDPNGTVYPYSVPDVAAVDDDMLAVWINDNTSRKMNNRTELMFARYDSHTKIWTDPQPIKPDSNTADMNPQLISLADGNAACIWQDAKVTVSEGTNLGTFLPEIEIMASIYNGQTWSNTLLVSNNTCLDRSPRIAGESSANLMAVWIENINDDTWGNESSAQNTIMWSKFDGINWTSPASQIVSGIGKILGTTLAYNGSTATYVYCLDTNVNPDPNDPNDHELYMLRYSSETWETPPTPLTTDGICDAAPQLAYDADGELLLFWLRGNNICMAKGLNFTNRTVVRAPGESMGSKDFDLVVDNKTGQIALIWSDVSRPYDPASGADKAWYDIWACYYEPSLKVWSLPRQLTWDDAAERFVSGAFGSYRDLFCVYDKTQTEYVQDPNFLVAGKPVIKPKRGRSDLYSMSYRMGVDLSVPLEDLEIKPTNPLPGTEVKTSVVVKNLGEYPASDIQVTFFRTDHFFSHPLLEEPNINTFIGSMTIDGPLVGGDQIVVVPPESWDEDIGAECEWGPPQIEPVPILQWRELSVEISSEQDSQDQDDEQQNRDANDNSTTCKIMRPDLAISEMTAQAAGPNSIVTARVANEGALKAENVKIVFRENDPNTGTELDQVTIGEGIVAGAYYDVSVTVPSSVGMLAYAIVDPNKSSDEFNEDNNIRSIQIKDYNLPEPPVVVGIYASEPVAREGQSNGEFIVYRVGQTDSDLTVSYDVNGTAESGDDYDALNGSVTITKDVNWVNITVTPINNNVSEVAETVIVTLVSVEPNDNCQIASLNQAVVVIQDDEPPIPVYICASDPIAKEAKSPEEGQFTVYRTGNISQSLTVYYSVDGTAVSGDDYMPLDGFVTILTDQTSAAITIVPNDDGVAENTEWVILSLAPDANYTIDSPNEAMVFIIDDDQIPPVVSIEAIDAIAKETEDGFPEDEGQFTVSRTGSTDSSLTISYTVSGTATSGDDYETLSGSVQIPMSASSATITVTPINDVNSEDDETVIVKISPSEYYEIGSPQQAAVVIEDNDTIFLPTVEIEASLSPALEAGPVAGGFTVRSASQIGPGGLVVRYKIRGSASYGQDYLELYSAGAILIPNDSNSEVISITPIDDPNIEEHELVVITIEPNDAYRIGPRNMAVVVIEDDDWYVDWERISCDGFEAGWGSYCASDSPDASIHCGRYASDGSCAANIQDGNSLDASFVYSSSVDVNDYNQIRIIFDFTAIDLADGEGFRVEYYDGSLWQTVAAYTKGDVDPDFANGTLYQDQTVDINDTDYMFPTNMKIRFSSDASSDSDDIYIDRIRVSGKAK